MPTPTATRRLALAPLAAALALLAPAPAASRVKELVDVVGVRDNNLVGYGLVVGLAGTGDTERVLFTQQSIAGMLGRLGIRIDPRDVRARNVAAVMVTARLPAFGRPGTRIDVAVGSLGNARSLAGGVLLGTPLAGGDGKVYAVAEGPVQVSGFEAGTAIALVRRNTPTSGRIAGGAIVERAVDTRLDAGALARSLERVLEALGRGDTEGARAAAQETADACAALQARGIRLEEPARAALADACARAEAAAGDTLRRLAGELGAAARSRRAADAYGGPTSPHRNLP